MREALTAAKSRDALTQRRAAPTAVKPATPQFRFNSRLIHLTALDRVPSTKMRQAMVRNMGLRYGNAYVQRYLGGSGSLVQRAGPGDAPRDSAQPLAAVPGDKVAFVSQEGLNLRAGPDQHSASLRTMKFGERVYVLEDSGPQSSWLKVNVLGQTGYAFAAQIHHPPQNLIEKDPALRLIKVRHGLSLWALVKEMYGIQGNESTKDQNMNHFINAIRAVNQDAAFDVRKDRLDKVGNFFLSGRDAKNTFLKENYRLWIPSFGVAARMDVGSGTVRGEITRIVKKIDQKIEDFKKACVGSAAYMGAAIKKHAGEMVEGLLEGLIDFALDAVKILAVSTAAGALIGALFGGVGAIPGAAIGFEIGLMIIEYYGLAMLIEAVFNVAADLVSQLGTFISLVWDANGDPKEVDKAAHALAEAIGILVSAILAAAIAYLLHKGTEALGKTKFAKTVGESRLAQFVKDSQKMKTTGKTLGQPETKPTETKPKETKPKEEPKGGSGDVKGKTVEVGDGEELSLDKERKVRVADDGSCEVCASPCDKLRAKYADEIAKKPEYEGRIKEIEKSNDSKSNKAKRYREVEQDLANERRAARLDQEPQRLRDFYKDQLADRKNEAIKDRLDAAEKIADPKARLKALADVQKELADAKHPGKVDAYHGPKPKYTNPGHHAPGAGFRGGGSMTTALPLDAEAVYQKAIPDAEGRSWYGRTADGEVYRYAPNGGNDSGVHWNGRENSPRGLVVPPEVRARFNAMDK